MLVQHRRDGRLRLFRQHDHALVSGELAAAWTGPGREPEPLSFDLVLATTIHDLAWIELDARPRVHPEMGRPLAFHEFPVSEKVAAYRRGLDRASRIHPYAGLLGSLHYASFPDVADQEEFQTAERGRRSRLRRELQLGPDDDARVERDLEFLRLFDSISIFLCLTPPSADSGAQPPWVEGVRHAEVPGGGTVHFTWVDDEVIHVDPFPFRGTLELRLPYREAGAGGYETGEALERALESGRQGVWWVEVRSALRLA